MNIPLRQYSDLFLRYLRPQRGRVALLAVLLLSTTALPLVNPQILRAFIDRAVAGDPTRTLILIAALFIAVALAMQAVQVAATYVAEQVGWTATNMLREDLLQHALRLDMSFHNTRTPGEMIERIDGDVTALSNFFSQFVIYIAGNVLFLLGVLVVFSFEEWRVGLVMTVFTVVTLVVFVRYLIIDVHHFIAEREAIE